MPNMKPDGAVRPAVESRSVLVLEERHRSRYFVVDNDEELHAAALVILRGRLKSGYFYHDPGPPPEGPGYDNLEKIPSSLHAYARLEMDRHADRVRSHSRDKSIWDSINLACSQADGEAAWEILLARSDRDGERICLQLASTSYGP